MQHGLEKALSSSARPNARPELHRLDCTQRPQLNMPPGDPRKTLRTRPRKVSLSSRHHSSPRAQRRALAVSKRYNGGMSAARDWVIFIGKIYLGVGLAVGLLTEIFIFADVFMAYGWVYGLLFGWIFALPMGFAAGVLWPATLYMYAVFAHSILTGVPAIF